MNIFEEVKEHLTARQVAEYYGIHVKHNGMCCCPFHPDRNPSLKVDKLYHCFGCGVGGDVIDFTARFHNLSQFEAAKKLISDFSLPIQVKQSKGKRKYQKPVMTEEQKLMKIRQKVSDWVDEATNVLIDYAKWIQYVKENYSPAPNEDWNEMFMEALENEIIINNYLDILMSGTGEEILDFFKEKRDEVRQIEKRNHENQRRIHENSTEHCGGRNADSKGTL